MHCIIFLAGTTLLNPCTPDAIKQNMFYHPYPLDSSSYVQCTEWGTPLIRRCPAHNVWSAEYVTCVDASLFSPSSSGSANTEQSSSAIFPQPAGDVTLNGGQSSSISQVGGVDDGDDQQEQVSGAGGNNFSWQTFFLVAGAPTGNQDRQLGQPQSQQQNYAASDQQAVDFSSAQQNQQSDASVQMTGSSSAGLSVSQQYTDGSAASAANVQLINAQTFDHYNSYMASRWLAERRPQNPAGVSGRRTAPVDTSATDQNPCSQPNVRFVPDPSRSNYYYECVGLLAAERMCPSAQVWMQDRGQCVASANSASPCSGVSISQQDGTSVALPYPGDPYKYIVCYDSTRFAVGTCPSGQIWSSQATQCVAPTSAVPPSSPTSSQTGLDICAITPSASEASFYHPYPPNPSRFLQCDEFGNVYLRYCGPNKIWKDEVKTCVGGNNVTISASTSTDGQQPASGQQSAVASGTASVVANSGSSATASGTGSVPASAGGSSSGSTVQVLTGNTGVLGGGNSNAGNMQTVLVTEIFRIVCPQGYHYRAETGVCTLKTGGGGQAAGSTGSAVSCPPSFEWDGQLHLCVHRFTVSGSGSSGIQLSGSQLGGPVSGSANSGSVKPGGQFGGPTFSSAGGLPTAQGPARGTATVVQPPTSNVSTARAAPSAPVVVPVLPDAANPCAQVAAGTVSGFYFPFPGSTQFFIQCDATGIAFVKPCPTGLLWDQDLVTCVRSPNFTQTPSRGGNDTSTYGNYSVGIDSSISANFSSVALHDFESQVLGGSNPCSLAVNQGKYFPVNNNPAAFLHCANNMGIVQYCPDRMIWNPKSLTCTINMS